MCKCKIPLLKIWKLTVQVEAMVYIRGVLTDFKSIWADSVI